MLLLLLLLRCPITFSGIISSTIISSITVAVGGAKPLVQEVFQDVSGMRSPGLLHLLWPKPAAWSGPGSCFP